MNLLEIASARSNLAAIEGENGGKIVGTRLLCWRFAQWSDARMPAPAQLTP